MQATKQPHIPISHYLLMAQQQIKVIGISGPSCSGKTCLARHLRLVAPNSALIYEDNFYKPDNEIPLDSNGQPDWDVPQAFDLEALASKIKEIKDSNELPPYKVTREDGNSLSDTLHTPEQITELKSEITESPLLIVEGIFLFHEGSPLTPLIDYKFILEADFSVLKARREARKGYQTTDGFWQDPPSYFENHVWPRFVKYSASLYTPAFTTPSQRSQSLGIGMLKSDTIYNMLHELNTLIN